MANTTRTKVVYTVTVRKADGDRVFTDIGAIGYVGSTPPMVRLQDLQGHERAALVLSAGDEITYVVAEIPEIVPVAVFPGGGHSVRQ